MTREDIVRFATRDWAAVADDKAGYWVARKRTMTPADVLRLGDDLRRHALSLRPDWPDDADRAADRDTHVRVTEALRAVASPTD
jgi:uncharacterized protein YbjT (DUF2867 family)